MTTSIPRFFLNVLLATTCALGIAASVRANEVTIGTGAAAAENIFRKIEFPIKRTQNIELNILYSGPVQALKDLDAGKVHCAVGGVAFGDWMELMKKENYAIPDPSVYRSWVIGQDKVKVLTNLDVPVKSLSKEQLVAIFSGTAMNWSQVGGPDQPIIVVLGNQIPGTLSVFKKQVMGNAEFTKNVMTGTTVEDVKSRIIRNSGAVGICTLAQVDYLVNSPDIPEIARPITLVTKGAPTEDVMRMINYINTAGQRYIIK
ncbi:MAG: substrate-binding domain-containing protein [Proteobacteria bacterium]|nr:substrate-binding domain-containing protein [Pseudomonadota bacterium]